MDYLCLSGQAVPLIYDCTYFFQCEDSVIKFSIQRSWHDGSNVGTLSTVGLKKTIEPE